MPPTPHRAGAVAEGYGSLLEVPTKLVTPSDTPGWWLTVCPEAFEAGGTFVSSRRPVRDGLGFPGRDPDRSLIEARRRARGQMRRFAVANRLNRLGTLTYAGEGCHDPKQIRADLGVFFRKLRKALGGDPLPYLWVPELHPKGHGWHAHFLVGRYVHRSLIKSAWPHGFVHIKLIGDLPVGSGTVAEARAAARYGAKYLSKESLAPSGLHRYEPAEGFQPAKVRVYGRTREEAVFAASELIGSDPTFVWTSDTVEDFDGPPSIWASWDA